MSKNKKAEDIETGVTTEQLNEQLKKAFSWQDAYNLGKKAYSLSNSRYDRFILDAFEKAFFEGLNVHSAPKEFFDATKIAARLYFAYSDFYCAISKLMLLIDNEDAVPDWVHSYYASAQIHTENIYYIAANPTLFFARLDRINRQDPDEVKRRNDVYKEFLSLIWGILEQEPEASVESEAILKKAVEYRLDKTSEFINFYKVSGVKDDYYIKYIKLPAIGRPCEEIELTVKPKETVEPEREIELAVEAEEVGEPKQEIEPPVEAEKVEELEDEISGLKGENARLKALLGMKDAEIRKLNEEAALVACMVEQGQKTVGQNEFGDAAGLGAEAPTKGCDLLQRNQQILVLGDSAARVQDLIGISKNEFGYDKKNLEFVCDYEKTKAFTSRIVKYDSSYAGIIAGPCPHRTENSGGYSSFLTMLKSEVGYPHVEVAHEESGELKITKSSFRKALGRMTTYLASIR